MLERIIELTAENLGADAATITAETSFKDDLHADSLDLFELAMAFGEISNESSGLWKYLIREHSDSAE